MNNFAFSLLMAAPQASGGSPRDILMSFLPLVAIIAIFYFLMIRPRNQKIKETEKMLAALKKGDKVVTVGGLHGTVQSVKESTVIIKADDNVKLEFLRSAVSNVIAVSKEKVEDKSEDSEDKSSDSGE